MFPYLLSSWGEDENNTLVKKPVEQRNDCHNNNNECQYNTGVVAKLGPSWLGNFL
jgi:hypothetical protein